MKKILLGISALALLCMIWAACKNDSSSPAATDSTSSEQTLKKHPAFDATRAYNDIQTQVNFGPRVPGTKAQKECANWMEGELNKYCDSVYRQEVTVTQPVTNKKFPCINLIGSINPQAATRIVLLCHWDSRGMADQDVEKANHNKPIDAADDGASGVGVILEIARAIKTKPLDIGVDILFADVEDMGLPALERPGQESTYCLGSRYWALNPHKPNYRANYGICLDMVGARGAQFVIEENSYKVAPEFVNKVWSMASQLGYSSYFVNANGGAITDDHMELNKHAGIPSIDIIGTPLSNGGGFGTHWHTLGDNMSVIDKATLNAVGNTVLGVLYNY